MAVSVSKEELCRFLAEYLDRDADELCLVVMVTCAKLKSDAGNDPHVAVLVAELEQLAKAGYEMCGEEFKDMVEDYVLSELG